jgi:phage terminase large subunit
MELKIMAWPLFLKNYQSEKRITINRWGTSSSKTGSLIRLFLNWLITGKLDEKRHFDKWVLSIVRKYSANLRTSVQRDFEDCLDEYNLWGHLEVNKTDKTYKYKNRIIEFIGVDDPQKARGPRRDILYCNEANELTWEDYRQLSMRTRYKVFIDFNPDDEDVWINQELEIKRTVEKWDVNTIVSTYRDNPFLDRETIEEIERIKEIDPIYWMIYWQGQYGKLEGRIFNFIDIDTVPKEARLKAYGQDFWYTNDPSSLVAIYEYGDALIWDEVFYQKGMSNKDISDAYKDAWLSNSDTVWADSSEPKSIDEINAYWWNIKAVVKGPDSIRFGISLVKQRPVYVTARSLNLRKEWKKYIWKTDKNGKPLNEPVDKNNHAIDAWRYCVMMEYWDSTPIPGIRWI